MKKFTFTTQFTRTPDSVRKKNVVAFKEPSKVKESLSYATDINTIYDNYCKTGRLPLNGNQPIYDENFIKYDTLIEAQQAVKEASAYFASLPTDIRNQYGNDLGKFVQAIHSQDNFLVDKGVLKLKKDTANENIIPDSNTTVMPSTGSIDVVNPTVQPTVETPVVAPSTTA